MIIINTVMYSETCIYGSQFYNSILKQVTELGSTQMTHMGFFKLAGLKQ